MHVGGGGVYVSGVHMCACVNGACCPLTPGLEEAQCVPVALSLDVPQLRHAQGEQALLDPPPVVHVELQLHVGHVEEGLYIVVVVFLQTDVKVTGERGHSDDIVNVLSVRDVAGKAFRNHSLEEEAVKCRKCKYTHTKYTHTHW